MTIPVSYLFYGALIILGGVALVYLILVLSKFLKTLDKVNSIIDSNEKNIKDLMDNLPKACENVVAITDNVKDISDVAVETTASAVVAKENISDYITTIKDILLIIKKVFLQ